MRHHGISPAQKLEHALDVTPRHRLSVLLSVIETDLKPLVELRNTLAHGQWYYAFNSAQSDLNPELMKALNNEHLRGLQHKREIAAAFAHCVQDLLVSDTTFERDFDTHFHRVPCSCDWARRRRASLRRLT